MDETCDSTAVDEPLQGDAVYSAFVSYRHTARDTDVAKEVQRFLEGFVIPRGLRGGNGASHLGKVFRDEDELPAASRLSDRIQEALSQSCFLIVVCSPETAESPWVKREIEFFSEIHGREHVLAVLAAGEPSESFPMSFGAAEPLAADLRAGRTRKQRRRELLRLVAAIIGCSLDDLIRRSRARRRTGIIVALCVVVVVAVLIVCIVLFSNARVEQSTQVTQATQSDQLAAESLSLLAQGDRIGALRTALSALPSAEDDTSRPYVASVRAALTEALGIYPSNGGWWQPVYSLDGVQDAGSLVAPASGDWFALCEGSESVKVYDLVSGSVRYTFRISNVTEDAKGFSDLMEGAGVYLAAGIENGILACFDTGAGELLWSLADFYPIDLTFSDDASCLYALGINSAIQLVCMLIDSDTGDIIKSYTLDEVETFSDSYVLTLDEEQGCVLVAANAGVCLIDFQTDEIRSVEVEDERVTSVYALNDVLVVVGSDMPTTESIRIGAGSSSVDVSSYPTYAHVEAMSRATFEPLWERDFTWESYQGDYSSPFNPDAVVREGITPADPSSNTLLITAGKSVFVIAAADGEVINEFDFESPVVWCSFVESESGEVIFAATFEGTYFFVADAFDEDTEVVGDTWTSFPEDTWLVCETDCASSLYFVGVSAENLDRLFVYRCDLVPDYYGGVLVDGGFNGGLSANCDSTLVAWLREDDCLVVCDSEAAEIKRVIGLDEIGVNISDYENVSLAFSADDSSMLYLRDSGRGNAEPHIWRIDATTGNVDGIWSWEYTTAIADSDSELTFNSCTISDEHVGTFTIIIPYYDYIGVIDAATFETIVEFMPSDEVPLRDAMMIGDTRLLMRFEGGTAALYDPETLVRIGRIDGYSVANDLALDAIAAVSGDAAHVVLYCEDGYLRSFECEGGRLEWEVPFASGDLSCFVTYTPDDSYVFAQDSTGQCYFFNATGGQTRATVSGIEGSIAGVTFSAEGNKAYISAADTSRNLSLYVIDLENLSGGGSRLNGEQNTTCGVECVIPDGRMAIETGNTTQIPVVFAGLVYLVEYYPLGEIEDLAEIVIEAFEGNRFE